MTPPAYPSTLSLRLLPVLVWLGAAALLASLLILGASPLPAAVEGSPAGALVRLSSADARVILPGECIEVAWQTSSIKAVFLNGEATVGEGTRQLCGVDPRLRIVAANDHEYNFRLERDIFALNRAAHALALGALALGLAGLWAFGAKTRAAGVERTPRAGAKRTPQASSLLASSAAGAQDSTAHILVAALLILLALLVRLPHPASVLTPDEWENWIDRTEQFRGALSEGNLARTMASPHPGVLTMWLGTIGMVMGDAAGAQEVDYMVWRAFVVAPAALVNALAVGGAYLLLARLRFGAGVAPLAGLLLALTPFLVAHGQVLHIDALATSFMTLAFLSSLVAFRLDEQPVQRGGAPLKMVRWRWLMLSAVFGGLAMLAKMTAVLMGGFVGVAALIVFWRPERFFRSLPVAPLLAWGAVLLLTWCALYPATWVRADRVVNMFLRGVDTATAPHDQGNFFMGAPVEDPGLLFYPVATAFRLTPWELIGLVIGAGVALRQHRERDAQLTLLLLLYALLFLAAMALQAKKFDRYGLPAFPPLLIAASYGLTQAAAWLRRRLPAVARAPRLALWGWVTAALLAHVLAYLPHALAYYNPLLGGGRAATQVMLVGWGEGLDLAANYIHAASDDCDDEIMAWHHNTMKLFFDCQEALIVKDEVPDEVRYVVLYRSQLQRQILPALLDQFRDQTPVYTVTLHDIEYAYVYDRGQR